MFMQGSIHKHITTMHVHEHFRDTPGNLFILVGPSREEFDIALQHTPIENIYSAETNSVVREQFLSLLTQKEREIFEPHFYRGHLSFAAQYWEKQGIQFTKAHLDFCQTIDVTAGEYIHFLLFGIRHKGYLALNHFAARDSYNSMDDRIKRLQYLLTYRAKQAGLKISRKSVVQYHNEINYSPMLTTVWKIG